MSIRYVVLCVIAAACVSGCTHDSAYVIDGPDVSLKDTNVHQAVANGDGYPEPVPAHAAGGWGDTSITREPAYTYAVVDGDGPYLLDTGDRLRIFVYGQPNLSRLYIVDHDGRISVPLIGEVMARGKTTVDLQRSISARLGSEYVRDPQVTVDIQQNRPFFILGEVKNAGQYPYVSGMSIETAIAIAGGYSERASARSFRVSRRINGFTQQFEVPSDFTLRPGDTVYVFERFF